MSIQNITDGGKTQRFAECVRVCVCSRTLNAIVGISFIILRYFGICLF